MSGLFQSIRRTQDWPATILVGLVLGVAGWILLLPVSSEVQRIFLARFHLASASYCGWCLQQLVPSMYNFENRYWVSDHPLSNAELETSVAQGQAHGLKAGYVNHFSARVFTFGDGRLIHLQNKVAPQYLYLQSSYRDETLNTIWTARPLTTPPGNEFRLVREGSLDE